MIDILQIAHNIETRGRKGERLIGYFLTEKFLKERDRLIDTWPRIEGELENVGKLDIVLDKIEEAYYDNLRKLVGVKNG